MPTKMKTVTILFLTLTHFVVMSSSVPPENWIIGVRFISYHNYDGTTATGDCCDEPEKTVGSCTPDLFDTRGADNWIMGVRFISYHNYDGTTSKGDCCDEPGKTVGSCTPDLCDTGFAMCATLKGSSPCNMFPRQMTPITYNNNSFEFGSRIGNEINTSSSLLVLKFDYKKDAGVWKIYVATSESSEALFQQSIVNLMLLVVTFRSKFGKQGDVEFIIEAIETAEPNETTAAVVDIAKYNFVIDWVDPIYDNKGIFRRFVLNDTHARLVIDAVSQCRKHYYTHDCSVYCKPNVIQYNCLDNGTKECLSGWNGTDCDNMIDYCPGNKCEHGSTCVPVVLDYTCTCPANYTGKLCELDIMSSTSTVSTTVPTSKVSTTVPTSGVSTTVTVASSGSETNKSVGGDGDDIAGLAAGVSVGALFLLLLIAAGAYFIYKNKRRGRVTPDEKANSSTEKEDVGSEKKEDAPNSINITLTQSVGDTDQIQTFISGQHPPVETAIEI